MNPGVEVVNDVSPGFNSGNMDLATEVAGLSMAYPIHAPSNPAFQAQWVSGLGLVIDGLELSMAADLVVLNMQGRLVHKQKVIQAPRITIPLELRKGIYSVGHEPAGTLHQRFVVP